MKHFFSDLRHLCEYQYRLALPMTALVLGFALTFAVEGLSASTEIELEQGDFVAICGDSITQQQLYSAFIESYLAMCKPEPELEAMCMGWSGETSLTFLKRMDNDAIPFKPSVVTLCFGMNDGGHTPLIEQDANRYRDCMTQIVENFQKAGTRAIVIGSPGAVDTVTHTKSDPAIRNDNLRQLTVIAKEVAAKTGTGFVDIHSLMLGVMAKAKAKFGPDYHVAGQDGVHPAANGHIIMAYAFLRALGCQGEIGTITVDGKAGTAEGSDGHKILSAAAGKVEVESEKYPYCFAGDPTSPDSPRGVLEFLPFNQDLNRFTLVVTNAPSERMKVTWGGQSKMFWAVELEQGINLAAEFPENPFSEPFSKIHRAVVAQQSFDVRAVKFMQHSIRCWKEALPEFGNDYRKLSEALIQKTADERKKVAAMVKPVKHTITIEAAP